MQYYLLIMQRRRKAISSQTLNMFKEQTEETQAEIAKRLGISQSTVSRRFRKAPKRHSDATEKLCNYADTIIRVPSDSEKKKGVQKAFDTVWGKSPAHAAAISQVIQAFADLCLQDRDEKERSA